MKNFLCVSICLTGIVFSKPVENIIDFFNPENVGAISRYNIPNLTVTSGSDVQQVIRDNKYLNMMMTRKEIKHVLPYLNFIEALFHEIHINSLSFNPDGTQFLSAPGITIWDANTGKRIGQFPKEGDWWRTRALWDPAGKQITSVRAGNLILWNIETDNYKEFPSPIEKNGTLQGLYGLYLAYSPDGSKLASIMRHLEDGVSTDCYSITIRNTHTGAMIRELYPQKESPLGAITWSFDGTKIIAAAYDKGAFIWDANTGEQVMHFTKEAIYDVKINYSNQQVALIGKNKVFIWDLTTNAIIKILESMYSLRWRRDGSQFAGVEKQSKDLVIFDNATGKKLYTLKKNFNIRTLEWNPNGKQLITGTQDKSIIIWDLYFLSGEELSTITLEQALLLILLKSLRNAKASIKNILPTLVKENEIARILATFNPSTTARIQEYYFPSEARRSASWWEHIRSFFASLIGLTRRPS